MMEVTRQRHEAARQLEKQKHEEERQRRKQAETLRHQERSAAESRQQRENEGAEDRQRRQLQQEHTKRAGKTRSVPVVREDSMRPVDPAGSSGQRSLQDRLQTSDGQPYSLCDISRHQQRDTIVPDMDGVEHTRSAEGSVDLDPDSELTELRARLLAKRSDRTSAHAAPEGFEVAMAEEEGNADALRDSLIKFVHLLRIWRPSYFATFGLITSW